ncbi:proteasome assembly chaperone 2 isoform X2 [Antennarius striatus]
MVSTLNMSRVGYMHTDCLVPMAGNNPYSRCKEDAEELHTSAEVYSAAAQKLAVLQIRAPIIETKTKKFIQLLLSWIKTSGFSRTVVLSSSHAYQRDDQQLRSAPLRYLATPSLLKAAADAFTELGWREMERVPAFPGLPEANAEPRLSIPGGGITKRLFTERGKCLHSLIIVAFFMPTGCRVQLCRGSPTGCAAALLFGGRQHPRCLHARQPPQRLAPSTRRSQPQAEHVDDPVVLESPIRKRRPSGALLIVFSAQLINKTLKIKICLWHQCYSALGLL